MRSVIVTGASRGLGREIAIAFARAGRHLVLSGRDRSRLEETRLAAMDAAGQWVWCPPRPGIVTGDLREPAVLDALEAAAAEHQATVLVMAAGVYRKGPLAEWSDGEIRAVMETNLIGPMLLAARLLPIFARHGGGLIVTISSAATRGASLGESAYAASKSGLSGFASALRPEAAQARVRVLDVIVGAMQTSMLEPYRHDLGMCIDPAEVAETVVRLADDYRTLQVQEVVLGRWLRNEGV